MLNKKWIYYFLIVAAFVLFGVLGFDKFLYSIIHVSNCNSWTFGGGVFCVGSVLIGKIFSTKMWLAVFGLGVIAFFIYKALTNENDFRYAFVKIKNSYVFYIFTSVLLAAMTTGVLKILIGRSRPILFDALGQTYFEPWVFDSIFNSMPSGHSAASFAGLVMIGKLFPRVKWGAWILAVFIGLSRIYVGAHWPSDVVFGAFIGALSANVVWYLLKRK